MFNRPMIAVLAAALISPGVMAATTIEPLVLPGTTNSVAVVINNAGVVLGSAGSRPFKWTAATGVVELPTFAGTFNWINLNESGVAAAQGTPTGAAPRTPYRWTEGTGFVPLPFLPSDNDALVSDINESGDIIGTTGNSSFLVTMPVVWPASGGVVGLGSLGGTRGLGRGINDFGQIVGASDDSGGVRRGFRTTIGAPLVPMPSPVPDGSAVPAAILNDGRAVGVAPAQTGAQQLLLWSATDTPDLIPLPAGFVSCTVGDANQLGEVVGSFATMNINIAKAMYYSEDTGQIDLNTLLPPTEQDKWNLQFAADINDIGQIVGLAQFDPDGTSGPTAAEQVGFIMQIPEPCAVPALLAAILCRRDRRRLAVRCDRKYWKTVLSHGLHSTICKPQSS